MLKVLWMVVFGLFAIGVAGNIAVQIALYTWEPESVEAFCSARMTASLCK